MDWDTTSLDLLMGRIWDRLRQGCLERQNAWHVAALATTNNGRPAVRSVVLRSVDPLKRALSFFSDIRAAKIRQLSDSPRVEWLFYDPAEFVQVRIMAAATVHNQDQVTEAVWKSKPNLNYLHYLSLLPPGTSLPAPLPYQEDSESERDIAYRNFAVVMTAIEQFDWLLLRGEGKHRRACFRWDDYGFDARWLTA